ncbi:MAG: hypothetical protein UT86_C0002G0136 [Candidatus Magasanikbacteria bacterium GW2011_GWC2_40_17]|uniref:Uncharacterized protein n=1 Tax=Candidatus Magasanikbacteria bacterium GW2011_GWA2_42_32 TaxID=1619039 RepID=A0A0G1A8B1_9BACT|nr:MAG: hypothetical protein UT86_C0002G0136 [Candidatus Magasanikbacteria bacterium GW2011_GWC2_40_17]KKS57297.1 MAG: hypothetical protein UV20_C0002G0086 [Candidatus Magasanikbacteria bacterium GW2011_GWA2_42_32]OGH85782.1 MAG: hypothetical protein A2294_02325 [Candidatus Magasanikbacteria bacterium RIFOXYB2_FULL_38_10]
MAETLRVSSSEMGLLPEEVNFTGEKSKKGVKKAGEVVPLVKRTKTASEARVRFEELRAARTGEAGKKRMAKIETPKIEPSNAEEDVLVTPKGETYEAKTLRAIKERASVLAEGTGAESQQLREQSEKELAAQALKYKEADRKKKTEDLFDKTMDSIIIDQQYKDTLAGDNSFGEIFVKKDLGLLRTKIAKTVDDLEKKMDLTPEGKVKGWDLFGFKKRKMEKTEEYKRYQAYREMQEALISKVAKAGDKVAAKKDRFLNETEQRSKWVVR